MLAWLRLHEAGDDGAPSLAFNFLGKDRKYIAVEASCLAASLSDGQHLAVCAQLKTDFDVQFEAVERENEFLRKVIEASVEAMWCIEFQEPVDLSEDEDEVVRQVFENRCSWRLCNKAMARLYNIPGNADLNEIPVSKNFPRSRANERYIRGLIRERFNVDLALSIDIKYDGEAIYGDNSVRSDIVDNKLLRFWGTMHDVTRLQEIAGADEPRATLATKHSWPRFPRQFSWSERICASRGQILRLRRLFTTPSTLRSARKSRTSFTSGKACRNSSA